MRLTGLASGMRERLDACLKERADPPVEAVHRLRTSARRVEATLELLPRLAGAQGLGDAAEKLRDRWMGHLKKVRRAAGRVRDLDVHRTLLAENYLPHAETGSDTVAEELSAATRPGDGAGLTVLAQALDVALKARRVAAANELCGTLDRRADRLVKAEEKFLAAIAQYRPAGRRKRPARLALEDYVRLADAMPFLDKRNLHDFRKGAKKARYVAESDEQNRAAGIIAKAIKRAQDGIGAWHDWDVLGAEAQEALGMEGRALRAELHSRGERAYSTRSASPRRQIMISLPDCRRSNAGGGLRRSRRHYLRRSNS